MKSLASVSFLAFAAVFAFASCETKNTEAALTENVGEAMEADVEASLDSMEANTGQAVDAAAEATQATAEVKAKTKAAAAEIKE